jgi:hypothetical protein
MSPTASAILREVRRGADPDELQLVTTDGRVILLTGYGLTPDEKIRMREAAFKLLSEVLGR